MKISNSLRARKGLTETKISNFITVRFRNEGEDPAEIMLYDDIGKDPWSGEGISAEDFAKGLKAIPRNKDLKIRINSRGGDVWEGMTIRSLLDEWPNKVTSVIDGVAASTASWCCLGSDEVQMSENAQMFIHDAIAMCFGNAADMEKAAKNLNTCSDQIAGMYSAKNGKPVAEMRQLMKDETLMTGKQAKDLGLVDVINNSAPVYNFTEADLSTMKNRLQASKNSAPNTGAAQPQPAPVTQPANIMTKQQMIALLNKHRVTIPDNATDAQLLELVNAIPAASATPPPAAPPTNAQPPVDPRFAELENRIKALTEADNAAKTLRITNAVQQAINEDRIPAVQKDAWVKRATADETLLNDLAALPSRPPGVAPVNAAAELSAEASPKEVLNGYSRFNEPMNAWKRGNSVSMKNLADAAMAKGLFFAKNQSRLMPILNTNTVATELKRSAILQISIRDFVRRLLPLRAFSTVFANVPLEGTNKVEVPFYDLDSSASTSFVLATGYTTLGNTTTDKREITIGTAAGAGSGDRLYQGLSFTSEEIARQPFLKILELTQLKVEKLASDVVADVLSVVTLANFGAAAIITPAAAFSTDDVATLKLACKLWPDMARSLILDSAYDAALLKDPSVKSALNFGGAEAIRDGKIPKLMGFDYMEIPTIPSNAQNLVGFAVFQSAVLVATAPVPPVEEVRNAGTTYEIVTDPQSGVSFEYRTFGDNVTDTGKHFVECSYGYQKGNGNALKRITSV